MSRFQGYVGIVNYMGARFTASEQALAPVLRETAKRGLIYVDDGSSPRSVAGQIAGATTCPSPRPTSCSTRCRRRPRSTARWRGWRWLAREHGIAVGIATALPATIDRIAEWAKAVEGRGIVLVPITMVAIKAKSIVTRVMAGVTRIDADLNRRITTSMHAHYARA